MYEEIPYKFKYMLNKITNCIIKHIIKNLGNNLLIETKLILINNYIIDIFDTSEGSRNACINNSLNKINNSITFIDKSIPGKIVSTKYDNNISFSKLSNVFINLDKKELNENLNQNSEEKNNYKVSPYKDKFKIIRLKKLLKNEQEKSAIKELSYLKKLSFVQEKLNYYETKKKTNDKARSFLDLDNKHISVKVDKENEIKTKINNSSIYNIKLSNNDYITLINNFRNKKINFFYPNTTRVIKHSKSQIKILNKNKKGKNN